MSAEQRARRQPAARQTTAPLTDRQRVALFAQARSLFGGEAQDTIRQVVAEYPCWTTPPTDATQPQRDAWPVLGHPCTSARHLTRAQARELITRWGLDGAPVGRPYTGRRPTTAGDRLVTLPTPAQRALIKRLRGEITWQHADGFERWIGGRFSPVKGGELRTFADAERVIEALRRMRNKQEAARAQPGAEQTRAEGHGHA